MSVRVGILWRREWDPISDVAGCRLHGMFAAFSALGVAAEPVVYTDDAVAAVRRQLLELDGVLVWVNPIEQGLDRSALDPLLREVADAGVWVSAHPDVISRMATKQVLVDTAAMSWSAETYLYRSEAQLRDELLPRLAERGPIVLKQQRGMCGTGVWKVELDGDDLRVQHAVKGSVPERVAPDDFVARCGGYFAAGGLVVEQPFQQRLPEGMIRVYLSHDRVVGFARQFPAGLLSPEEAERAPTSKVFERPEAPAYRELRRRMEAEWVPQVVQILGLDRDVLPVIWDADFLFGEPTASGEDTFVLCEINASSTFSFPEHAMPAVAQAALDRIRQADRRAGVRRRSTERTEGEGFEPSRGLHP